MPKTPKSIKTGGGRKSHKRKKDGNQDVDVLTTAAVSAAGVLKERATGQAWSNSLQSSDGTTEMATGQASSDSLLGTDAATVTSARPHLQRCSVTAAGMGTAVATMKSKSEQQAFSGPAAMQATVGLRKPGRKSQTEHSSSTKQAPAAVTLSSAAQVMKQVKVEPVFPAACGSNNVSIPVSVSSAPRMRELGVTAAAAKCLKLPVRIATSDIAENRASDTAKPGSPTCVAGDSPAQESLSFRSRMTRNGVETTPTLRPELQLGLELEFLRDARCSPAVQDKLAQKLGLSKKDIKSWFNVMAAMVRFQIRESHRFRHGLSAWFSINMKYVTLPALHPLVCKENYHMLVKEDEEELDSLGELATRLIAVTTIAEAWNNYCTVIVSKTAVSSDMAAWAIRSAVPVMPLQAFLETAKSAASTSVTTVYSGCQLAPGIGAVNHSTVPASAPPISHGRFRPISPQAEVAAVSVTSQTSSVAGPQNSVVGQQRVNLQSQERAAFLMRPQAYYPASFSHGVQAVPPQVPQDKPFHIEHPSGDWRKYPLTATPGSMQWLHTMSALRADNCSASTHRIDNCYASASPTDISASALYAGDYSVSAPPAGSCSALPAGNYFANPAGNHSTYAPPSGSFPAPPAGSYAPAPPAGNYSASAPPVGNYSAFALPAGNYSTFAPPVGNYSAFALPAGNHSASTPITGNFFSSAPLAGSYSALPASNYYSSPVLAGSISGSASGDASLQHLSTSAKAGRGHSFGVKQPLAQGASPPLVIPFGSSSGAQASPSALPDHMASFDDCHSASSSLAGHPGSQTGQPKGSSYSWKAIDTSFSLASLACSPILADSDSEITGSSYVVADLSQS